MLLNQIVLQEVSAVLNDIIDKLVESKMFIGVCRHRRRIDGKTKAVILRAYDALLTEHPHASGSKILQLLRSRTGAVELRSLQQVKRWRTLSKLKKRGRKVNVEFEQAVFDQLVYTELQDVGDRQKAEVVIANVCYSHALIVQSAKMVRQQSQFATEDQLIKLKFSRPWIRGFLRRNAMRPRRITAQLKDLPSPAEVQQIMSSIQKTIQDGGFSLAEVFNGDETGIFFGAPPKKQYVPLSADRATSPETDDKTRISFFFYADGTLGKWGLPLVLSSASLSHRTTYLVRL